jgi:hypothetical protein
VSTPVSAPVSRRSVLLAGITALAAPGLVTALAGCADEAPDPLVALIEQARSDAALAEAAAKAVRGAGSGSASDAELLTALAQARRAHADTMAGELGDDAPPPPAANAPGPPAPDAKTAVPGVRAALESAQRKAADAVAVLPRQRAALVGSIAACCGAYRAVLA